MTGVVAILALALAVVFHGYGFAPNHWFDWTGMVLIGAFFLALHMLGIGSGVPITIRRRD